MFNPPPFQNVEVLLVDDEPSLRDLLNRNILNMGYNATIADSAEKALDYFNAKRFNILVTDIKMGKMTGTELSEKLRAKYPALAIIFITGYPSSKTMSAAQKVSAIQYIPKPVDMHELAENLGIAARWNVAQLISKSADRYFDLRKGRLGILENKVQHIKAEIKNIILSKRSAQLLTDFAYSKTPQTVELFKLIDEKMGRFLRTI